MHKGFWIRDPETLAAAVSNARRDTGSVNRAAKQAGLSQSFLSRLKNKELKRVSEKNFRRLAKLFPESVLEKAFWTLEAEAALRAYEIWLKREEPQDEERTQVQYLWNYLQEEHRSYTNRLDELLEQHEPQRRNVAYARICRPLLAANVTHGIELGWEELEDTWRQKGSKERDTLRVYLDASIRAECILLRRQPAKERAASITPQE